MHRILQPFHIVDGTTSPSFVAGTSLIFLSTTSALEATGLREFAGPNRSARLVAYTTDPTESQAGDFWVNFGTSDIAIVGSTDSILVLGGTVETFLVANRHTHIAVQGVSTTTGIKVNVTLGYGQ